MNKSIIISNSRYTQLIPLNEIIYCKAIGSYSEIVLTNKKVIIVSKNLHWIEQRCNTDLFFRTHKSYIINLLYVCQVCRKENTIILLNDVRVPLSRIKKKQFWMRLQSFHK